MSTDNSDEPITFVVPRGPALVFVSDDGPHPTAYHLDVGNLPPMSDRDRVLARSLLVWAQVRLMSAGEGTTTEEGQ